jgi:hypothetical protein
VGMEVGVVLNSVSTEEGTLPAPLRAVRQRWIDNRLILSTGLIVLMGLLLFLAWNELVSEFDASVNDFASSFNIHDRTDTQ